jgi:hypothetical protein
MDQRSAKRYARHMAGAYLDASMTGESDLSEELLQFGQADGERLRRSVWEIIEHLRRSP